MISNTWEELSSNGFKNMGATQEEYAKNVGLPKWMNLDCPYCNAKLGLRSIREFGLKLNPRNFGDIFVQICCDECKKLDTLYFKAEAYTVEEFIGMINGTFQPLAKPMLEDDMYKANYNNLLDLIHNRMSKG